MKLKNLIITFIIFLTLNHTCSADHSNDEAIKYYNLGIDEAVKENYSKSIDNFKRALTFNPELTDAYYNLGIVELNLNNKKDAVFAFIKVLDDEPENYELMSKVVKIYHSEYNNEIKSTDPIFKKDKIIQNLVNAYQKRLLIEKQLKNYEKNNETKDKLVKNRISLRSKHSDANENSKNYNAAANIQGLPPEVLADGYLLSGKKAFDEDDFKLAHDYFSKIENLGVNVPNEFYYQYAKTSSNAKEFTKAKQMVTKYLAVAGSQGKYYKDALLMYNSIGEMANESERKKKLQEAYMELRKYLKEKPILKGCEICLGGYGHIDPEEDDCIHLDDNPEYTLIHYDERRSYKDWNDTYDEIKIMYNIINPTGQTLIDLGGSSDNNFLSEYAKTECKYRDYDEDRGYYYSEDTACMYKSSANNMINILYKLGKYCK